MSEPQTPDKAPYSLSRLADGANAPRKRRPLVAVLSVAAHGLALWGLLAVYPSTPKEVEQGPMNVSLVDGAKLFPVLTPTPTPQPQAAPAKAAPQQSMARRTPIRAVRNTLPPGEAKQAQQGSELSDSQIAGAASADSGPAGGACDMARLLQSALRKDNLVQSAVAASGGKAILVWNGDWVKSGGEDGKGLAAVREAIMWEIGFAPAACKSQPVHGLILLSLNGSARLAMGQGEWRWADLLKPTAVHLE